ncbi:MAG: COR domain-containing protein, partial [Saprospiraceae bacterium]
TLGIGYNNILDYSFLPKLKQLTSLFINFNNISDLSPLSELYIKDECNIRIHGNPISNPPKEIVEKGQKAIARYFRELKEKEAQKLYESKLIIVGPGGAGKTTLFKKILDKNHPVPYPHQESTLGIEVHEGWEFPWKKDEEINYIANIWDFGGQPIQYMTHQFFLTARSLYILVADERKGNTDYAYWFKIINVLGKSNDGIHSPVMVLINKKDGVKNTNFDLHLYQKNYPDLDIIPLEIDLADQGVDYDLMIQKIQTLLSDLKHIGIDLPKSWTQVREELQTLSEEKQHIDFATYASVCEKYGVEDEDAQLDISRYLHDLGIILHFTDVNDNLMNLIVLNPKWALDAVYAILEDETVQGKQGIFSKSQVEKIWKAKKYSIPERGHLMQLLQKDSFDICYKTTSGKFIAPQLLPSKAPQIVLAENIIQLQYEYPFMPHGIITRIIVQLNQVIAKEDGKDLVWKKGVFLAENNCDASIKEREIVKDGKKVIAIKIKGEDILEKKIMLRKITDVIDAIHKKSFSQMIVNKLMPCNCEGCVSGKNDLYSTR